MKAGTNLEKILSQGEFAVTAELGPPKSADQEVIKKKADILRGYADAVNITDNQTAIVRMSSIAAGALVIKYGLEPVIQMTCRDRNRIAIQSDLLGAYALGIRNVLCLSGDHQVFGNHPKSKNVYDIDSINLVNMLKSLRDDKVFLEGEELEGEFNMFLGAAANPFADPFEFRVIRLAKKIAAGADFIQTQTIFDVDRFEEWMEMVRERGLHERIYILAGVMPVRSPAAARYMRDQVAGVTVPDSIVKRLSQAYKSGGKDKKLSRKLAREEGVNICLEIIERVRKIEGVRGIHIMAVEWEKIVPSIVERAGLLPRPKFDGMEES